MSTSPPPPRLTFLPDILEEHIEELSFLLLLRDGALRAPDAQWKHIVDTDARISAHLDGIIAVGDRGLPLIEESLAADDPDLREAATTALLALSTPRAVSVVADVWDAAPPEAREPLARALRRVRQPAVLAHLVSSLDSSDLSTRAWAARAVARHSAWRPGGELLHQLVGASKVAERVEGWALAMEVAQSVEPRMYAAALRDDACPVREVALLAAAWCGVRGALDFARRAALAPTREDPIPLRLLAALGDEQDAARLSVLAADVSLGALRFELIGLFGSPSHVPALLAAMEHPAPREAIAAGFAFTRMTGVPVASTTRSWFPREDVDPDDPVDTEFEDDGFLPDVDLARATWQRLEPELGRAPRVCGGRRVDRSAPTLPNLTDDMELRWWNLVRARFAHADQTSLADFERFPAR